MGFTEKLVGGLVLLATFAPAPSDACERCSVRVQVRATSTGRNFVVTARARCAGLQVLLLVEDANGQLAGDEYYPVATSLTYRYPWPIGQAGTARAFLCQRAYRCSLCAPAPGERCDCCTCRHGWVVEGLAAQGDVRAGAR